MKSLKPEIISAIFQQMPFAAQLFDPDGNCLKINKKMAEEFQISLEDIEGNNKYNIFNDNAIGKITRNNIKEAFKSDNFIYRELLYDFNKTFIYNNLRNSGATIRWYNVSFFPIRLASEKFIILIYINIDFKKENERYLLHSVHELRVLNEIIKVATEVDNLNDLSLQIINCVINHFHFDAGGIYLNKPNTELAEIKYSLGLDKDFRDFLSFIKIKDNPFREVFLSNKSLYLDDLSLIFPHNFITVRWKAFALIPLISKGAAFGAFMITNTHKHNFNINEKRILDSIGREIGNTVARFHLELEQKINKDKFSSFYNNGVLGLFECSSIGKIIDVNPALAFMLGYNSVDSALIELKNKNNCLFEENEINNIIKTLKNSSVNSFKFERKIARSNSNSFFASVFIMAIKDYEGNINRFEGFIEDITDRKLKEERESQINIELEKRVLERTNQLQLLNKQIEAFSYSVSHDLRAPLRQVKEFNKAIIDDFSENLDPRVLNFLHKVEKATEKMNYIIDDLFLLAHITRQELNICDINLTEIAKDILINQIKSEKHRKIEFYVEDYMTVKADLRLVRILLENLINNAIKFTSNITDAIVKIGSKKIKGKLYFFVNDNGAGFDMNYYENLFIPFGRLHPEEQFKGNGIGLATVSRIIEKHGGIIFAESKIDKGSTFYFKL